MPKLIAANWKENPRTEAQAAKLYRATVAAARKIKGETVICPPFIFLEKIAALHRRSKNRRVVIGAQDVFWKERGPFTSEVGPRMLKRLGVKYAIIGHSERRKWLHETDAMINKKVKLALADGLRVILCVGEPLAIRKKGINAAKKFVEGQLKKDLAGVTLTGAKKKNLIVAYEPIWAIGTGRNDTPDDALHMARVIRRRTHTRVLYGGSVNGKNIGDYVQYKEIDGALVGGASTKPNEFKKILWKAQI